MKGRGALSRLLAGLDQGRIVPLSRRAWESVRSGLPAGEAIETGLAGQILLIERPGQGWLLVEEPNPDERVVRPLASEAEARALIADRLAAYERMWDG